MGELGTIDSRTDRAAPRGLMPYGVALILGGGLLVFARSLEHTAFSAILVAAGAALASVALGLAAFALARRRAAAPSIATIERVIGDDATPCLLTGSDLTLRFANRAAVERLDVAPGMALPDVLRDRLAHPAGLLERLARRIDLEGVASEDVLVGDGAVRVSGRLVARDLIYWRVDDFTAAPEDETGVPTLSVGRNGAVLAMNGAARRLLGRRVRDLTELTGGPDPRNGGVYELAACDGRRRFEIRRYQAGPGRSEVALLPATELGALADRLLESLPIALAKVEPNGVVTAANAEARELLGLEDGPGARLGQYLEGLGRPISDWLADASEGRGLNRPEFLRLSRAPEETFVQVALTRVGGADLIAVMTDATELKTLEAQFVQSQKMQAIGQLAGGIAHDFNNLLTAISGHCDLILLRHDKDDQDYDDLVQINQNANRAASLVGQLLAFSRKQTMKAELLDLRETLADLTHLLNRLVGERVSLELRHEPSLPAIRGDRRQLEQVMMNLVVNARDAMTEGGRILIETERLTLRAPMKRDRAVVEPGEYVVVKVSDTGCGIPQDKVRSVFEPFYTTKRNGEGTGLGLSTVYGIIKQSGGFIFLDSDPGVGTEFKLIFPAHARPAATPVQPPAASRPSVPRAHTDAVILLVEDEAPVRAFASRGLRHKGFTVIEAENGEEALSLLEDPALSVDLIVSDMIMPGLDGPAWVRRAREAGRDVGVVFVSGYAADALEASVEEMENAVFLQKPFSLAVLAETVQTRLDETMPPQVTEAG
ncbi:ATP-binding protein [Roseivivax marinus]|uniref:hybrid sensor histidine kinase/response regulator n=1 Tax=Roseivivax marinus TaxID=1379903 RepID=UPI001F04B17F|nr:ATP-binding protein [Roseivivax marinus]UMA66129.1 ATP-binding protein [Roseivivax marinus]